MKYLCPHCRSFIEIPDEVGDLNGLEFGIISIIQKLLALSPNPITHMNVGYKEGSFKAHICKARRALLETQSMWVIRTVRGEVTRYYMERLPR